MSAGWRARNASKLWECPDAGQDYFEERYREREIRNLTEQVQKLGFRCCQRLSRLENPLAGQLLGGCVLRGITRPIRCHL